MHHEQHVYNFQRPVLGVTAELWKVSVDLDTVENQNQKAIWCVLIQGVVLLEVQVLKVLSPDP